MISKNKSSSKLNIQTITNNLTDCLDEIFPLKIENNGKLIGIDLPFTENLVNKYINLIDKNSINSKNSAIFYQERHFSLYVYFFGSDVDAHSIEADMRWSSDLIFKDQYGYIKCYSIMPSESKGNSNIKLINKLDGQFCHLSLYWDIVHNIEECRSVKIAGWVFNRNLSNFPISLLATENGRVIRKFDANTYRIDVEAVHGLSEKIPFSGFNAVFTDKDNIAISIKNIVVSGSNINLIEEPKVFISETIGMELSQKIRLHFMEMFHSNLINRSIVNTLIRQISPKLISGIVRSGPQINAIKNLFYHRERSLSVIIPVYDGYQETISCIQSVLNSKTNLNIEILIGFDDGPDKKILDYLKNLKDKRVKIITNRENIGFVANVNNLVSKKSCYDFILLNSDTIIGDYLFDNLLEKLNDQREYSCVSPLGSNATIFTYVNVTVKNSTEIISIVRGMNDILSAVGRLVPTPVAHGFCMLVNGYAYDKLGLFDLEAWGLGYGEEVDWCLNAFNQLGLVSGCDTGSFVYHAGSVSFGAKLSHVRSEAAQLKLEARHPGFSSEIMLYEFEGELNQDKIRIDLNLASAGHVQAKNLIITHNFGGGVEKFVGDRIQDVSADGDVLVARVNHALGARFWVVEGLQIGRRIFRVDRQDEFVGWLNALGVRKIFVEHIGHGTLSEVQSIIDSMNIATEVMLHDFALICPKINLIDYRSNYCGVRDTNSCETCISQSGVHDGVKFAMREVGTVEKLREASSRLLASATTVLAPSRSTKALYNLAFPTQKISVRKHHADSPFVQRLAKSDSHKTVAVFGAISDIKGLHRYKELANFLEKTSSDIRIVIFGYTADDNNFSMHRNVIITGRYDNFEELNRLVEYYDPTASLHLPIWPETFSYTLSESLKFGLYPFYHAIGAIKERLVSLKVGKSYRVDQDVAQIARDLEAFFCK